MTVGAIGPVRSGQSVYVALSPYLNGVVRTSDAARAAQVNVAAQTTSAAAAQAAIAAQGTATAAAVAAPPFANPAITAIGQRIALGQALTSTTSITPDALLAAKSLDGTPTNPLNTVDTTPAPLSATNSVLTGDAGLLIQSYGAVALLTGPAALQASAFAQAATSLVPAPAAVTAPARVSAIA
jgi:hypothetical protein